MDFLIVILLMVVPLVFKAVEKQISKGAQNNAGIPAEDSGNVFTDSGEEARAPETMEEILATFFPKKEVPKKYYPKEDVLENDGLENDVLESVESGNEKPIRIPVKDYIRINGHKQGEKVSSAADFETECNVLSEESESKSEREKIDARKLIIYSEIMKPKF